jgi:hypothetical protein
MVEFVRRYESFGLVQQTNKVHWKWFCNEFGYLYWMDMMMNPGSISVIGHHKTLLKEEDMISLDLF